MTDYRLTEKQREYYKAKKRESRARLNAELSPEQKKERNRRQYLQNKQRYKDKAQVWQNKNRPRQQAIAHQAAIRKRYPEIAAASSIQTAQLIAWVTKYRGGPCPYCSGESTHIDHRISLSSGGEHEFHNLQMLCKICNLAKRDMSEETFFAWIKKVGELIPSFVV